MSKSKDKVKESKDGETNKLKRHIRHLEKENNKLKSEIKTAETVLAKNIKVMKERSQHMKLEELLENPNIFKEVNEEFETMEPIDG